MHTTVREANDRGYECLVLSDCVGSYFPEFQRIGLEMITAQGGIFGWVAAVSGIPASALRPPQEVAIVHRRHRSPADHRVHRSRAAAVPWWTRGDTNAFFGLGFNILVNVLVLTGLMHRRGQHPARATCSARSCPRSASSC